MCLTLTHFITHYVSTLLTHVLTHCVSALNTKVLTYCENKVFIVPDMGLIIIDYEVACIHILTLKNCFFSDI
jgi:hypothetical protein